MYEGDECPGFLAIGHGSAVVGLQKASAEQPAYCGVYGGSSRSNQRPEMDDIIAVCQSRLLEHDVIVGEGGDRFRRRYVTVRSPSGVAVWFEGPNEV